MRLILALFLILPSISHAYFTTLNTGSMLKERTYRLGVDPQIVTGGDFAGGNINARFDMGFNEEFEFRATGGFGKVDYHLGGYAKWIPIPDYDRQPAMGVLGGLHFARINSVSVTSLRLIPIVSKAFDTEESGLLTPYASLPLNISFIEKETVFPIQLATGLDWKPHEMKHTHFGFELGLNLNKAFTYIAFSGLIEFDEEEGMKFD